MNLYSAPRPPRKKPQPRVNKTGQFRPVDPLDDPVLFDFVRDSHQSLVNAAKFLERVPMPADEPDAARMRLFVVAYLRHVAESIGQDLVIGDGRGSIMGLKDG